METRRKLHVFLPLLSIVVALALTCSAATAEVDDVGDAHSESWAGWAKDKISEGLGLKSEDASDAAIDAGKNAKDKVTDAAKNAKDKISDTAKRSSEKITDTAKNTEETVAGN